MIFHPGSTELVSEKKVNLMNWYGKETGVPGVYPLLMASAVFSVKMYPVEPFP